MTAWKPGGVVPPAVATSCRPVARGSLPAKSELPSATASHGLVSTISSVRLELGKPNIAPLLP